jgi:nicotinamidase-related amidase/8-oxo-dGTP pyrophosphatase MutT (NUDIX family)
MKALILVDIQNDFLPGGALAVPDGDAVIPLANQLQAAFALVVATKDWHPADHGSFAANHPGRKVFERIDLNGLPQTLWPVHCVQGTRGAELAAALKRERIANVFPKGMDTGIDSYSGFFDNGHRRATGLGEWLRAKGVTEVYVCGLATDYCVKFTALDAVTLGFQTHLIEDACRGVNLRPDDVKNAVEEMRKAGIHVLRSSELLRMGSAIHANMNAGQSTLLCEGQHLRLLRRGHWEYVERVKASGAAVIVAVTDERNLLLTEQFRPPVDRRVIELPAGLAGDLAGQETEQLTQAARRELLEETGYEAETFVHLLTGPSSAGLTSESVSIFHATGLRRVSSGGGIEGEKIIVHEVPLENLRPWLEKRISDGLLVDPKVFAGLWLARQIAVEPEPNES